MKVFIALNTAGPQSLLAFETVVRDLKKSQISITTAIDLKKDRAADCTFEDFDALVLDGSSRDTEIGYFLAIALAHKKPVLYLLPRGESLDSSVEALAMNKEVKKCIKIAFYNTDNLMRKIKSFLQYLDHTVGKELFTIKYTLRLSPRLDRYLTWKAQQTGKNKADYLRDWVDGQMKSDEDYRKRLE